MSNDPDPLGENVTAGLLKSVDGFESAVMSGNAFLIALAADALAQNLSRFFAKDVSSLVLPSGSLPRADSSVALLGAQPNTDPEYLEKVRQSIRAFKESISHGAVPRALEALVPIGVFVRPSPSKQLDALELEASRVSGGRRLLFLPEMAKLALWMGNLEKAEQYAAEALHLTRLSPRDFGEAIHDGNMVLGLVALGRNDAKSAKEHLLAAAGSGGSHEMAFTGPNLTLAAELLRLGEREVVVEYLRAIRTFWVRGRNLLDEWIRRIQSGEDVKFDLLYFCS